jgi:hypothetical protein
VCRCGPGIGIEVHAACVAGDSADEEAAGALLKKDLRCEHAVIRASTDPFEEEARQLEMPDRARAPKRSIAFHHATAHLVGIKLIVKAAPAGFR